MVNKIFFIAIAVIFCNSINAQEVVLTGEQYPEMRYLEISGSVYYNEYQQIRGSAFLIDDWREGDLYFKNGKIVKNVNLKIDLYSHQILLYHDKLKRIIILNKLDVQRLVLHDNGRERRFWNDEIIRSKSTANGGIYCEILTEGKIVFQKIRYKERIFLTTPTKPYIYEFVDGQEYRLRFDSKSILISLNKRNLFKLFPEHKQELKNYIKTQHLKLKREDDFAKAISYLNEIRK